MKTSRKILLFLYIFCLPALSFSQYFNAVRTSNFDGVQNIILNPASAVDNKTYLDINLITSQLYLKNNFFFIPQEDFDASTYLFNSAEIPRYDSSLLFPNRAPFYYHTDIDQPLVYGQMQIMGPSVNLSLKKHSFSIFSSFKSAIYSDIPGIILRAALEGHENVIIYDEKNLLGKINSGLLLWSEIGMGYATILNPAKNNNWYAGANIKYLSGYYGGYLNKNESFYTVNKSPLLTLHGIDINFGSNLSIQTRRPMGYGVAIDLGIHYIKRGNSRPTEYYPGISKQSYGDYKYKFGFSVIDIGRINFSKNSTDFSLQSDSLILIDGLEKYNGIPFDSIQDYLLKDIRGEIMELIPTAEVENKFYYSLPAKISFQFDYHLKNNWYCNFILMAGINTMNSHIKTPAQITFCPRYESKDIEIWLPFTYNTIYKSQLGIALRYKFLTIGTENLLKKMEKRDFTETDFFISLNLPLARDKFRKRK